MPEVTDELVVAVRRYLGDEGHEFFSGCLRDHGTVSPLLSVDTAIGTIPHPVHFREGMSVRNFMRSTGLCDGWTDHDFDNLWMETVSRALDIPDPGPIQKPRRLEW